MENNLLTKIIRLSLLSFMTITVPTNSMTFTEKTKVSKKTLFITAIKQGNSDNLSTILSDYSTSHALDKQGNTTLHLFFKTAPQNEVEEVAYKKMARHLLCYAGDGWHVLNHDDKYPLDYFDLKKHACIADTIIITTYAYLESKYNKQSTTPWSRCLSLEDQYKRVEEFLTSKKNSMNVQKNNTGKYNFLNAKKLKRIMHYTPDFNAHSTTFNDTIFHDFFKQPIDQMQKQKLIETTKVILSYMNEENLLQQDTFGKLPLDYFEPDGKHALIKQLIIDCLFEYLCQRKKSINLAQEVRINGTSKQEIVEKYFKKIRN